MIGAPALQISICFLVLKGFEKCAKLFEELDLEGTKARVRSIRPDMSGKMLLLAR